MKNKSTFDGQFANPVSNLFSNSSSRVPSIFFLGSGSRSIVYQRALIPSKYLAKAKAANCNVMFAKFTKELIDWADVVVFQRVGGRSMEALVRYCRMVGIATVFDIDDDVFNYPEAKEYEATDTERVEENIRNMMQLVDIIVVTEEKIKESAQEHTITPIEVVKNYIDIEMWDAPKKKNYIQPDFIIGWAGGHFHSEDLKIIEEPMRRILHKHPNVKFVTVGDKIDSLAGEFPEQVIFYEFTDVAEFPDLMHKLKFSIGLAPLSESDFSNARSNIRLLHYSLLGIPTIASNFGPYARAFEDDYPMITVANTVEAWEAAINKLIADPGIGEYYGTAAREAVEQKYRAELLTPKWMSVIRKASELCKRKAKLNS